MRCPPTKHGRRPAVSDTPRTDAAIAASAGQWSFPLRDLARELERELAAERALADRLAALLQRDRDGYGGQVVDPACDCCDCEYLGPIDASLAAWREARRQADPDHDSHDETTYQELP